MSTAIVSVIIPTYNSAKTIELCLRSIKEQTYANIEIIIVDQYSDDETRSIAKRYKAKILTHRRSQYYTPPTPSRNLGVMHTQGKYIFHVDSDMELTQNVVEACVKKCEDEGYGAIVIPEIDIATGFWGKCKAFERINYLNDSLVQAARFFNKRYLTMIGGYDERLSSGEDWDLHQRINQVSKVSTINAIIQHHIEGISLVDQIKKKYYYGKTIGNYIHKHKKLAMKQLNPWRICFKNRRLFTENPLLTLGFITMRTCEFFSAVIGLIVNRFINTIRKAYK